MKILYIYDKMPGIYQKYLLNLIAVLKLKLNIKTLVYDSNINADFQVKRYGIKDYLQYCLYKMGLSKYKTIDIKYMSNFDIIHIQHSFLWRKLEVFKNIINRPKIIVTLRGGDTYIKPWLSSAWQFFYNNSTHIAAFIVMSQNQKQYLHEKWNVSLSKIHVIPISFGNHSNIKPKFPNQKKLKLVSAFRMTWEKNIEGSIKFAKTLKEKGIDFQYDIYGDGRDLGQLYYLVDKFDLKNQINIKGKVENELLKNELINYDFFIQLSLSEAFPTTVIEAQSFGLPCIVSNSGGLAEAVIHGKTGVVLDYYESENMVTQCLEIWKNKELYYLYSKNALEFVNDNFTLKHEEEKLTKLYNSFF
jgi:glycosyltransferase involved in cell wall biosynthesis